MAYIDIIYKDCSTEEGAFQLQQAVHKCKPFRTLKPNEEVPFPKLERLVATYCRKYRLQVQWIRADFSTGTAGSLNGYDPSKAGTYHAEVACRKPYRPIAEVCAGSMYELYAKLCVTLRWAIGTEQAEPEAG